MPNDIANNMADTINQLEEDRIMLNTQLTDLQLAYNEQMLKLKKAKRLLKAAVEDFTAIAEVRAAATPILCPKYYEAYMKAIDVRTRKWQYVDEALALIGEDTNVPASKDGDTNG